MTNEQPDYSKLGIWRVTRQEGQRSEARHELHTLAQQLGKSLDVAGRAKQDALKGIPPKNTEEPTQTELDIVNHGRSIAGDIFANVRSLSNSIANNVRELRAQTDACCKNIGEATDTKPIDVEVMLETKGSRCANAQEDVHDKEVNYDEFKRENELQREAKVANKTYAFIVLVIIVIIEGFVNLALFKDYSEFGIIGGFGTAFLVSSFNAAIAALGGFWCTRYTFHINWPMKVWGYFGTTLFASFCVFVLLVGAAHIVGTDVEQAAASADRPPIDGYRIAIDAILELELGFVFSTWDSTMLMIAGFIVMCVGFTDGAVLFKDRYPGFQDLRVALDDAKHELIDAKQEIIGNNQAKCIKHKNQLKEYIDKIASFRSVINEETTRLSNLLGLLPNLNSELTALMQAKVKEYRDINNKHRKTPSPAYFGVAYPNSSDFASLDNTVDELSNAKYDFKDWNDKCTNATDAAAEADAAIKGLDRRFSGK